MQDNTLSRLQELRELNIPVQEIDVSPNPTLPDNLDSLRHNQALQTRILTEQASELAKLVPGAFQKLFEGPTQAGFER